MVTSLRKGDCNKLLLLLFLIFIIIIIIIINIIINIIFDHNILFMKNERKMLRNLAIYNLMTKYFSKLFSTKKICKWPSLLVG